MSLIGLAIQFALGIGLLIYSAITNDWAVRPVAYPILLGSVVWIALAVVFHQHKLERLEALEAEAFRGTDASAASVFEGVAADQSVQANRLKWMHKWLLPGVSAALAVAFVLTGLMAGGSEAGLEQAAQAAAEGKTGIEALPGSTGFAIALGVGVAFVGFIFARFVAGMAKQQTWMLLNGGAGVSVGAAVLGLLIAAAQFMPVSLQSAWLLEHLPSIVSVAMYVLGGEIALNFLANLYRPRQSGQYLRPAFDSRVLAYVAAPDRLAESISGAVNYQFGFNVSSTWFYRLFSRWVIALVLVAAGLVWSMTSIAVVEPDERGLLLRGGTLVGEPLQPGITIKRPWPFDRVVRFPATAINTITVGTTKQIDEALPLLWVQPREPDEQFFVVQPARTSTDRTDESSITARDLALLTFEVRVQYVVRDLIEYYRLAHDQAGADREASRQSLLKAVAESSVTAYVSQFTVDEILSGGGSWAFNAELAEVLQARFDEIQGGVEIAFAGLVGAHPETEVSGAYEAVVASDPGRDAAIAEARADATETLSKVVGRIELAREIAEAIKQYDALRREQADQAQLVSQERVIEQLVLNAGGAAAELIEEARADRWQKVMDERGWASYLEGQRAAFAAAPRVHRVSVFLNALRTASAGARVLVVPPELELVLDKLETAQDFNFGAAPVEEQ